MSDEVVRKIGELTVKVDRLACIGSGNCVKVAPDLFRLDDEEVAAFAPDAEKAERDTVIEACEICPVEALTVTDAEGKTLVP